MTRIAPTVLQMDAEGPDTALPAVPDLLHDRNVQFWALNLAGFLGWGTSTIASGIYWGLDPAYNLAVLTGIATGLLLTGLLRELCQGVWSTQLWKRLLVMVTASYLVALLWQVSKNVALVHFYAPHFDPDEMKYESWPSYARGTLSSFYIILCWTGLYVGIKYYRMLGEERARALRAINSAREAQLRMLRYQLNPHFLFNTLNAISTLILEQETRQANGMVTRLSSFLRHSLDSDPMQKVTLAQEVKALRLYLEIEQVRFEERLTFEVAITPEAERGLIPSLLLQPLVENAIKYAVARSEDGGTITLRATVDAGHLEIEVIDDGPGVNASERERIFEPFVTGRPDGSGLGLAVVREIASAHGGRAWLEDNPNMTCFVIDIPWRPS
jgi:signal transduction histidine kinase